ncbi:hypothetical protein BDF21DRAFT_429192, partial [Thamnidium elegans]
MLKRIITLSFFASLVACKVIPVSPYPGKMSQWSITEDSIVDNTIYIFGGIEEPELEPYIVNPDDDDDEDDYRMRMFNPLNMKSTDIAYAYDIGRDQWRVETRAPFPWRTTGSIAINHDIFLFGGMVKEFTYNGNELWKYDTVKKNWSQKTSLPFLWDGSLRSCSINRKIYFTANSGHQARNIIHVYNIDSDEWEQPIFINKKLEIGDIVCLDESIKAFASEFKVNSISGEIIHESDRMSSTYSENGVFTIHYNGTTLHSDISQEKKKVNVITSLDEYFYFYIVEDEVNGATIERVNARTSEYEVVASDLPYNFSSTFFIPTDLNQVFLFGGSSMYQNFRAHVPKNTDTDVSKDIVKKWSHKIVKGD